MSFVPIVVQPPTPPSPRTRELAGLLSRVIEEYEKHHPAVTGAEVREALSLASQSSNRATAAGRMVVTMLLLGLTALGATAFYLMRAGGGEGQSFPVLAVVVAVLLMLGIIVVLKQRNGP